MPLITLRPRRLRCLALGFGIARMRALGQARRGNAAALSVCCDAWRVRAGERACLLPGRQLQGGPCAACRGVRRALAPRLSSATCIAARAKRDERPILDAPPNPPRVPARAPIAPRTCLPQAHTSAQRSGVQSELASPVKSRKGSAAGDHMANADAQPRRAPCISPLQPPLVRWRALNPAHGAHSIHRRPYKALLRCSPSSFSFVPVSHIALAPSHLSGAPCVARESTKVSCTSKRSLPPPHRPLHRCADAARALYRVPSIRLPVAAGTARRSLSSSYGRK